MEIVTIVESKDSLYKLMVGHDGDDEELLPRRKFCIQRMAKNLFPKHGERLLYTIRRTSFFRRFALISLLFVNCV